MVNSDNSINQFVQAVREQQSKQVLARVAAWSLLAASTVMLVIALCFVLQGYAVDRRWYTIVAVLGACATGIGWLVGRKNEEQAARLADAHFGLHDTLVSWLHFSRRRQTDGFYALQAEQAAAMVDRLDAQQIDWRPPRVPARAGALLAAVAIALAWKQPSAAVAQRLALEATVAQQTETINEELKELVDELKQSTNAEEQKLIEPDKLREIVEELATTRDQKEALRQYARLENKLNETRAKLQQRQEEHLMQQAATELEKSRETKPLGEKLAQKKYDEAAQELEQSRPDARKSLTEQKKELAKLKAAGQRMAAATKSAGRSSSAGAAGESSQNKSSSSASSSKGGSGSASGANGTSGGELENAIQEFDSAVEQWDEALAEASRQEKSDGKCDDQTASQCAACQQKATDKLGKLGSHMRKMAVKRAASEKMCQLCNACSQCQSGLCQGNKPGGKKAGWGTDDSRRNERDELVDNGQTQVLQGIKGDGPSQTSVEAAEDGSGVSRRSSAAPQRAYRRQYESFVSREDVPEQVKSGVRNYFESIHQTEEQK
jgi:hypothetical protein